MMLRNVVTRSVHPYTNGPSPTGMFTEFKLDCGHVAKRHGEQLNIHRLLCAACAAAVGEKTEKALSGR